MSTDLNNAVHRLRQNHYPDTADGRAARRADIEHISHALGFTEDTIERLVSAEAATQIVAERDALRAALQLYPSRNTHQLQAAKVCAGVLALADQLRARQGKEAGRG